MHRCHPDCSRIHFAQKQGIFFKRISGQVNVHSFFVALGVSFTVSVPFLFARWCNVGTGRFGIPLLVLFIQRYLAEALAPNLKWAWVAGSDWTSWKWFLVFHLFISSIFSLAVKYFLISPEVRSPAASRQKGSNNSGVKGKGIGMESLSCSLTGRFTLYV